MMVVEDMKTKLGLKNVRVVNSRAEELEETFDYMLGRSVSAVPTFLGFASHLMNKEQSGSKCGLFYIKGGLYVS